MKNKLLSIILVCVVLLTTGCGTDDYLKGSDGEVVQSESGQQLRKDILCQPTEGTDIYVLYQEYEDQMDYTLEELPACEDYTITSNDTDSLWELIFVKPTAYAISKIGDWVGYLGLSIVIVGILIRIILLPLQIKTSKQSHNMKKAGPELKKLEKKYENKKDQDSQLMKSQEMMAIYKKYKINPLTGCLPALIQLPVFFAFLNAIYRLPSIYEDSLFGFDLGMTPLTGIQNGEYQYILLMALIAVSTFISFKFTMNQNPQVTEESAKQTKMMLNFMTIFILFSSLYFPSALHFYWIATYLFIAVQTTVINKILGETEPIKDKKEKNKTKGKDNKSLKIKDKLDQKEGKKKYEKNNK